MIPFWYCILAVALTSPAAWWVGRGRLRAERMLRRAAEADAREGVFAVGRAEVQAKTAAALTNAFAAGTGLPPRVGLVLPDSIPPAVATDATLIGADHTPLAMTSVMRAEDLGDYAYVTAGEVDDPDAQVLVAGLQQPVVLEPDPDEPYDTEAVEDEPERPGPPPRMDDDDRPAPPLADETAALTMTVGPLRRYVSPTYNPDGPLEPAGQAVIPKWPAGWMRRSVALFRRHRPDVRLIWGALAVLPPLRRWLARMLAASVHHARHAARAGAQSWDDSRAELSARWHEERQALTAQLRYALAEQRTNAWRIEVGLMMDALKPPRRTIPPTLPSLGCTP